MDEYTCPKCGAILNNQKGFDPEYEMFKMWSNDYG